MSRAIMQSQANYSLSLTIINKDNDNLKLSIIPILSLTWLVMFFWQTQLVIGKTTFVFLMLKGDLLQQLDLYSKFFSICVNSLVWGMT